jgi:hypothetical protein
MIDLRKTRERSIQLIKKKRYRVYGASGKRNSRKQNIQTPWSGLPGRNRSTSPMAILAPAKCVLQPNFPVEFTIEKYPAVL